MHPLYHEDEKIDWRDLFGRLAMPFLIMLLIFCSGALGLYFFPLIGMEQYGPIGFGVGFALGVALLRYFVVGRENGGAKSVPKNVTFQSHSIVRDDLVRLDKATAGTSQTAPGFSLYDFSR